MKKLKKQLERIIPIDPPIPGMNFTREPVIHRFWGTGLLGLAAGFGLGFLLWLWQQGILDLPDDYLTYKLWHGRVQILLFAGSFLLGFALQAGPNVIGGAPPSSKTLKRFLPLLWLGMVFSLFELDLFFMVGNLLITIAFAGPAYLLFRVSLAGKAHLRIPRGIPLAMAFFFLAASPWLALDDPEIALFVLLCGPVTAALVAAQQLTNNVLAGELLQGWKAHLFAGFLLSAWILSCLAAFSDTISWSAAAGMWLAVLLTQTGGTRLIQSALTFGFSAIQVTLLLGFVLLFLTVFMIIIYGEDLPMDAPVHLLGGGVIVVLILGVGTRVAGFFSGKAVLPDRLLVYLMMAWLPVVLLRTATSLGVDAASWVLWAVVSGMTILIVWSIPMGKRLLKVGQQFPPKK